MVPLVLLLLVFYNTDRADKFLQAAIRRPSFGSAVVDMIVVQLRVATKHAFWRLTIGWENHLLPCKVVLKECKKL